jgi:phosphate starvation-inducible protein PhoH and related proteins
MPKSPAQLQKEYDRQVKRLEKREKKKSKQIQQLKAEETSKKLRIPKDLALKNVQALTKNQQKVFDAWTNGYHLMLSGSAGTGKTFLSLYVALCHVILNPDLEQRIIIVRSSVSARDVGFLPGSLDEKMEQFELPYIDIVADLLGKSTAYKQLKASNLIEFVSSSYLRGLTWDNAIIILDEIQNMTWEEIYSALTRVGEESRVIIAGDYKQDDLVNGKHRQKTGIDDLFKVVESMKSFAIVDFTTKDIVRSGFVRDFIITVERCLN